jgi:hypothetical protein
VSLHFEAIFYVRARLEQKEKRRERSATKKIRFQTIRKFALTWYAVNFDRLL